MGHLTKALWIEGAAAFISDAKRTINRARHCGSLGREYLLAKASEKLALADECLDRSLPPSSIEMELKFLRNSQK